MDATYKNFEMCFLIQMDLDHSQTGGINHPLSLSLSCYLQLHLIIVPVEKKARREIFVIEITFLASWLNIQHLKPS